jgi:O-antigen biosynthesis protein
MFTFCDVHWMLMGFAVDVHVTLGAYRLSVAPLGFGAGIKGKIADSWCNSTPSVATSVGAEGMGDPSP